MIGSITCISLQDDTQSEALARQLGDNGDSSAPDNLDAFTNREGDAAFCFPVRHVLDGRSWAGPLSLHGVVMCDVGRVPR